VLHRKGLQESLLRHLLLVEVAPQNMFLLSYEIAARAGVDRLVEKLDEDMAPVSAVHRFESGAVRVEYGREEFMEAYVREMCEPLVGEEATR
jgi:hypothetical protein